MLLFVLWNVVLLFIYLLGAFVIADVQPSSKSNRQRPIYLNQFAVHIPNPKRSVDKIAALHGFDNLGQIGSLDYYVFEHKKVHKRSLESNQHYHETLMAEPEVHWVQQQYEKKRRKRDFVRPSVSSFNHYFGGIAPDSSLLLPHSHLQYRATPSQYFPDPLFKEQWYLNGGAKNGLDMNVAPVWAKGYTGKQVVVSILDDGIQTNHPDLAQNYDASASSDINDNDNDPMPRDNGDNKHGTRCAGEVAAVAYNHFCGIGVAYNASIGGVRMLDGIVNDAVEARALGLNIEHIDIYSASWGPEDDGQTVDGPGPLARRAFIYGVTSGRQGKGSIFVWASGNGGRHTDSCNCDGYTNSIFTLSISSATQGGYKPWYLEECSSTLATTYSSGTPGHDKSVATVDMDGRLRPDHICTVEHTGTSASAPLAAGICALTLEANPSLTWRDMQYLVVLTSRSAPLHDSGWITNGVNRNVSHKFGYGLMDAGALVALAERWVNVPPQHICKSPQIIEEKAINATLGSALKLTMQVKSCSGPNAVRFLEHVQCKISLKFYPRGNLRIVLRSPLGTESVLLFERPRDVLRTDFDDWPFLSVHFWSEPVEGTWTLTVLNAGQRQVNANGELKRWQLIFYGTESNPIRLRDQPGKPLGTPWKNRLGVSFPFGGIAEQPAVTAAPPNNYFNIDQFKAFENLPNVYSFAGSEPEQSIASLDQKKTMIRDNDSNDISNVNVTQIKCDEQCDEQGCFGQGPTKCVACRSKRMDHTCVQKCPPRSFSDVHQVCQPCHEACETCTGFNQHKCLTCAPGHFKVSDLNLCLQQCPEGYYETSNGMCQPCHANCESCKDTSDHCTRCDHHLLLHEHQCMAKCPAATFETEDYKCHACHETCATCTGSKSSQCVLCASGRFWFRGQCLEECPPRHYANAVKSECIKCLHGCSECNQTGCTACSQEGGGDWLLTASGLCLPKGSDKCDIDQYFEGGLCRPCHSTCKSCVAATEDACLSCASPLFLQNNRCAAVCDNGFFHDSNSNKCEPCVHTCQTCTSRTECTECITGLQLENGECSVTCTAGYYSDKGMCERCYMSCSTCSGPGQDQCVSCPTGWLLTSGQCLPECRQGYYKTEAGCQDCESCRNCKGCERTEKPVDKEQFNVQALLLSAEPVSSLQILNSFQFMTVLMVITGICIIMLIIVVFVVLHKNNNVQTIHRGSYNKISIRKPKVSCNYNVVAVSDMDSSDSETDSQKIPMQECNTTDRTIC